MMHYVSTSLAMPKLILIKEDSVVTVTMTKAVDEITLDGSDNFTINGEQIAGFDEFDQQHF